MPRRTSLIICVFPSLEHSTWCVRKPQTILGLLCVPLVGTRKSAHCLWLCRTHPGDCSNVERHRTRCSTRHGRNPRILLQRIAASGCILERHILQYSYNKTYPVLKCKARGRRFFFYSAAQPTLPRRVCGLPQVHVIPAECR